MTFLFELAYQSCMIVQGPLILRVRAVHYHVLGTIDPFNSNLQ